MSEVTPEQTPKNETPVVNERLKGIEEWAYKTFDTNNLVQIPANGRKWLGSNAWWLVIIGGVLTLIGALGMLNTASWWSAFSRDYYALGYAPVFSPSLWWYLLIIIAVIEGVALLVASPKLKQHLKSGWNILFYLSLLGVVLGVVSLFTPGYGFGSFVGVALGVVISWTILMQIRTQFK